MLFTKAEAITIIEVDTQNKNGTQIGQQLGVLLQQHFPNIKQQYDQYLADSMSQHGFDHRIKHQLIPLKTNLPRVYYDEINAVATAWQLNNHDELGDGLLSKNEFWLLQFLADVGEGIEGSGFAVFGKDSAIGSPIIGRNLDIKNNTALRELHAIVIYRHTKQTLVNIGFAGLLGTLNAYNQQGMFMAHFKSGVQYGDKTLPANTHSIVFALRYALQHHRTMTQTKKYLSQLQFSRAHNVLIADTKKVNVLEQPRGQVANLRTPNSPLQPQFIKLPTKQQIISINCFALKQSPPNCINSKDRYRWQRYQQLLQGNGYEQNYQADVPTLNLILFDHTSSNQAIFNSNTLQSMLFVPTQQQFYLYTRSENDNTFTQPMMQDISRRLKVVKITDTQIDQTLLYLLWGVVGFMVLLTLWLRFR